MPKDSIDPFERPESRDKRIFINEAQKLLLGGRLSMDYGQGTPQDFANGGVGAPPKREIQTPSGNNNNFNPFTNENVSFIMMYNFLK